MSDLIILISADIFNRQQADNEHHGIYFYDRFIFVLVFVEISLIYMMKVDTNN